MADSPIKMAYLTHYTELRNRLRFRLGSDSQADDALHDTWIRLNQVNVHLNSDNPIAYLQRMAINISINDFRRHQRIEVDTEALLHIADDTLGPEDHCLVAYDIELLKNALACLPKRRREIFLASRLHEIPHKQLAQQYGISTRMIEKEIKSALEYCCQKLDRKLIQRFGPASKSGV